MVRLAVAGRLAIINHLFIIMGPSRRIGGSAVPCGDRVGARGKGLFNSLIVIVQIQNPESRFAIWTLRLISPSRSYNSHYCSLFGSCLHDLDLTPVNEL